jgi:hypothetical protein
MERDPSPGLHLAMQRSRSFRFGVLFRERPPKAAYASPTGGEVRKRIGTAVSVAISTRRANHFLNIGNEFVKPAPEKYFPSHFGKSELEFRRPASITRGGSRLSRTRGGMRWTRECCETGSALACGQAVGAWHPDAGVKFVKQFTGDGGLQARHTGATTE